MKKKAYIIPEMEYVLMEDDVQLLAGSLPIDDSADPINPSTVDSPELDILLFSED